jgi:hypothetical protein
MQILKPKLFGDDHNCHRDDILCADVYTSLVATGGYDGEINIWNTDIEKLFLCLRKGKSISP